MPPDLPPVLPPIGSKLRFLKRGYLWTSAEAGDEVIVVHHANECFHTTTSRGPSDVWIFPLTWQDGLEIVEPIARATGIVQCRRCGAEVKSGIAIGQTYVGHPDFPGDTGMEPGCTISPGGPGKVIQCQKCTECGHSFVPANGIGGEEIPDGLPDLPLLPKGYARWEYRGKGWRTDRFKTIDLYAVWWPGNDGWDFWDNTHPSGDENTHFIEAVKEPTSDPCESESPKDDDHDECAASGAGCSPGPYGPNGETQCKYCGEAKPTPPKTEGDTPRTDASFHLYHSEGGGGIKSLRRNMEVMESDLAAAREDKDQIQFIYDELRAHHSDIVTEADAEVKRLRAALGEISNKWSDRDQTAIDTYDGSGTEDFDDPDYQHASAILPLVGIAKAALAPANPNSTPEPNGWRPIETAPKDGTRLLLFYSGNLHNPTKSQFIDVGFYSQWADDAWDGWWELETGGNRIFPTHWMSLPLAPASSGKGEG